MNDSMFGAVGGIARGCGKRKQGGAYAECGLSPFGRPVEEFLFCPPVEVDLESLGIKKRVATLSQPMDGVINVLDWVGEKFYPNVADFIEEVRRFGMSRRLPKDMDFSKLGPGSRQILFHANAVIDDPIPFHKYRLGGHSLGLKWDNCPKDRVHGPADMCAGLWWEDVPHVEIVPPIKRMGTRKMPSFTFSAAKPPVEGVHHYPAMFAAFPITRIAVVRAEDGSHEKVADRASAAAVPVEVVEE